VKIYYGQEGNYWGYMRKLGVHREDPTCWLKMKWSAHLPCVLVNKSLVQKNTHATGYWASIKKTDTQIGLEKGRRRNFKQITKQKTIIY